MPRAILRRDFVRRLPVVTVGIAAGASAAALSGCAGTPYLMPRVSPGTLTIPSAELSPAGDAFVQAPDMERPIYVRRLESGEHVAVLASCTHRGCQPEPIGDRLACPCHGSEFSFQGDVLAGPASEPLVRFTVTEGDGTLVIRTSGRSER